jgi:DNA polymerase V
MSMLLLAEIAARHPGRVLLPTPGGVRRHIQIPFYAEPVRAGFPSPADDYVEGLLDLNEYLVHDEPGTFMVRVEGDSMIDAAILPDDVLVVDRGLAPADGDIVVAEVDGDFTVKELRREFGRVALIAHNQAYPAIILNEGQELIVFGVVTAVVRKLRCIRR